MCHSVPLWYFGLPKKCLETNLSVGYFMKFSNQATALKFIGELIILIHLEVTNIQTETPFLCLRPGPTSVPHNLFIFSI